MGYIPTKTVRIANATTVMGSVLPIGATIFDVATTKTYNLIKNNLATDTLTTLIAANAVIEVGGGGGGTSGFSGYSGYSGFSGFSGFGFSGTSGFSGFSGTGTSGFSGYSGFSGFSGTGGNSLFQFNYLWNLSIDTTPSNGRMSRDSLIAADITKLYVNKVDTSGHDMSLFLNEMSTGDDLTLHDHDDSDRNLIFVVSGTVSLTGNAFTIPVTFVAKNGLGFVNNENVNMHWVSKSSSGATTYLALTDTDNNYTGKATMVPAVNAAEKATAFVKVPKTSSEDETTGDLKFAVVAAMPAAPDKDTIYFVTS